MFTDLLHANRAPGPFYLGRTEWLAITKEKFLHSKSKEKNACTAEGEAA